MIGLYFNEYLVAVFFGMPDMSAQEAAENCMSDWMAHGDRKIYNEDTLKVQRM